MKTLIPFLYITIFLLFATQTLFSQDLIVTNKNDSINCTITKIDSDQIAYSFKADGVGEIATYFPLEMVNTYKRKYYTKLSGPAPGKEYQQLVISLFGGYSYRTAEVLSGFTHPIEEYLNTLKKGYNLGADMVYYFSNVHGLGFKYSRFRTTGLLENAKLPDGMGGFINGDLADDITISFIGPVYSARFLNPSGRNSLFLNFGVGYMGYINDGTYIYLLNIKGNTVGMAYDLGYSFGLSSNLTLGLQTSLYAGLLTEYELTNGNVTENIELEKEQYEGLGRIDISVRLSYSF